MQKWEYKVIRLSLGEKQRIESKSVKGDLIEFDATYLNELGEDGWELVVRNVTDYSSPVLVFKRPKHETDK
jgi:hypothetical protein